MTGIAKGKDLGGMLNINCNNGCSIITHCMKNYGCHHSNNKCNKISPLLHAGINNIKEN